jgi:FkbM family methyltransferase
MIFEVGDVKVSIVDDGDRMVAHMKDGSGFEPESLALWSRIVQPGMIALDVGAYTGLFSIIAALHGADVVAMEPMPANRWRLDVNACMNKVNNYIRIVPKAASDRAGTTRLYYSRHTPLTTGGSLEGGIQGHTDSIEVECVTIDSLCLQNVAALKIDVELHELSVIKGAMATIQQSKPPLIIETLNEGMRAAIVEMLPDYEVAGILDRRNTFFTPT